MIAGLTVLELEILIDKEKHGKKVLGGMIDVEFYKRVVRPKSTFLFLRRA